MSEKRKTEDDELYKQIKLLSNKKKYKIVKSVQNDMKSITEISKELNLAYNKCSNYISELEKEKLVLKIRDGKEVYVTSNTELKKFKIKSKK